MGLAALPGVAPLQGAPSPTFDEQLGTTFTQNFTSLAYNVTALAQADADGYGPGYILNGLTPGGYWYQVGVSYHWPNSDGSHDPGFGFSYQVYGSDGKSVYPQKGAGLGAFSGVVNSGDLVLLTLNFSGSSVVMRAQDWNTSAAAETSYSAEGASSFVGDAFASVNSHGFFTGLMTEWYHSASYFGNEGQVVYSNSAVALSSAWMWIDEFDTATTAPSLFDNQTQSPVTIADGQVYPFAAEGATMYVTAHSFVTGASARSSRLTLTPAMPAETGESSPSFYANYTLAGQRQTENVAPGTTVLDADPGTMITVSISETDSSQGFWLFSNGASPNAVTFAAGSNATYVYYDLVRETISYQVAGGGQALPASSQPELTYQEPPQVASATPSEVTATLVVSTTPATIGAILGSVASINGTIEGVPGERWATSMQNMTFDAPDVIPNPIQYYQQFDVSISYSIVSGGTPPEIPSFNSTEFGSQAIIPLSNNSTTGWFDAGQAYSFTAVLNSSTPTERWQQAGGGASADDIGGARMTFGIISFPNETISADYVHQYYVVLGVNDAHAGMVYGNFSGNIGGGRATGPLTQGPGWIDAGLALSVSATANKEWQFEGWSGSGTGAYTGTSPTLDVTVAGPLGENATFYPRLAISADGGTDVAYSYGSVEGTVTAGTDKTLYVPPSTNVTLRATPSLFLYSFASWQGAGLAKATKPSLALVVGSPTAVTGTSSYSYPTILGLAAVAVIVVLLAVSLLVRSRRRGAETHGFSASNP
jgi:hypothetical protein